ncbi:transglycosylase SLT domain-containing protein [Thermodesulfobacteriota bacterium]
MTNRMTGFFLLLSLILPSQLPAREARLQVYEDAVLPKTLSLCGEPMPLQDRHVREMLDREVTISAWDRAQVFMWLKRAGRYFPYIEEKLEEARMPQDLKYLAVAESSLIVHIRSSKGAMGTWQFMPYTGRKNGLRKDRLIDQRRDFERSTRAALAFLKSLKDHFGSWTLAMAAYNCGGARLDKEIKRQKVKDYYRLKLYRETERYIFRIAAAKVIMENPQQYGYRLDPDRVYRPIPSDSVNVRISVPIPITDVAIALGTDYKEIKELNPFIRKYHLPTGRYRLKVPPGKGSRLPAVIKKLARTNKRRPAPKIEGNYYVVRQGDTLSHISKKTGVPVSTLKKLNGLDNSLIRVGERIRLSP